MADSHKAQNTEVKVEDLLRLKRAERPDDAFWSNFDSELHQRMLQTLVKKDPWHARLLRGISGRIAQTTAVGAAAAFLAIMVVRPALVDSVEPAQGAAYATKSNQVISVSPANSDVNSASPVEVAMSDLDTTGTPDYQIEAISSGGVTSELGYTSDYALDTFEVAVYDSNAYATDSASFVGSGLATALVY